MAKQPLPAPIMFPLFPGPCVFWPRGVRVGDPVPAMMLMRSNNDMIRVLRIRAGDHAEEDFPIRHVDDPHLAESPSERSRGAWDYCRGLTYSFLVPGFVKEWPDPETPLELVHVIMHLANEGKRPSEIAMAIGIPKLGKDRVIEVLDKVSRVGTL